MATQFQIPLGNAGDFQSVTFAASVADVLITAALVGVR